MGAVVRDPGAGGRARKYWNHFCLTPVVVTRGDGSLGLRYKPAAVCGAQRMGYGNFGMFVRALA